MTSFIITAQAALALLASTGAFAQAYRCDVNGAMVYQQAPCTGGKPVNTMGAGRADPGSPAALQVQREIATIKRAQAVEAAILNARVMVGMTPGEVVQSWGQPNKVNSTFTAQGRREQWVYRRPGVGYDQYVYVDDGMVTTIQSSR